MFEQTLKLAVSLHNTVGVSVIGRGVPTTGFELLLLLLLLHPTNVAAIVIVVIVIKIRSTNDRQ